MAVRRAAAELEPFAFGFGEPVELVAGDRDRFGPAVDEQLGLLGRGGRRARPPWRRER